MIWRLKTTINVICLHLMTIVKMRFISRKMQTNIIIDWHRLTRQNLIRSLLIQINDSDDQ